MNPIPPHQNLLDYPDDEVWNSLDEFGEPIPGSAAEKAVRRLVVEGRICPDSRSTQGVYTKGSLVDGVHLSDGLKKDLRLDNLYAQGTAPV
ncbi:hypothetical protein HDU93_004092, partial [Gonapodya sp. JEL0774]